MKERGRVVETAGNVAKVEILRKDECSRCKVCGFGSRDRIVAVATNTIGAKEHDEVEVELEGSQVVRAAAILYLIPLAFLLAGIYLDFLAVYRYHCHLLSLLPSWSTVKS
jgi:sigma-E factor negative regulatory protein RseC